MASAGTKLTPEQCQVCRDTMRKYMKLADSSLKEKNLEEINTFNQKACGKMAKDVFGQKYVNFIDTEFAKCYDKKTKHMDLSDEKISTFVNLIGKTMLATDKPKQKNDEKCQLEYVTKAVEKLKIAKPDIKEVKQSKTGGVGRMTDTSQYTGSHKERFDDSGKGKGAAGRVDKVDDSGYVGNYKGEGTYDKK